MEHHDLDPTRQTKAPDKHTPCAFAALVRATEAVPPHSTSPVTGSVTRRYGLSMANEIRSSVSQSALGWLPPEEFVPTLSHG
ncbi:hypothetical protein, partial [Kitasatospora nipponensis]|uniref:hypothetical protein n=1 Tax=Kitasatospora nipponensis TaxID=258049 RepID=UPI0031D08B65